MEFLRKDIRPKGFTKSILDDTYDDGSVEPVIFRRQNKPKKPYRVEIVWRNVVAMTVLHYLGFYGWYLAIFRAKPITFFYFYLVGVLSGLGILCGVHRLWSHRSYKARFPLRVFLMILQTMALQNDIYEWVRDHRVHHKWSETDADPHNSKRGFFFAHMGWLLCRKHPEVIEKGKTIDLSDVWADPVVRFQRRFYIPLVILIWGVLPVLPPWYFWNEPLFMCISVNFFRYILSLHQAWLVNSWAHKFGTQPYDQSIEPRDTPFVARLSYGEGYHNYHHAFPWDYSASEFGWRENFNVATLLIDFMAWLGQAYDLKSVPDDVLTKRIERTGDTVVMRKPKNKLQHFGVSLVFVTWTVWLSFLLRWTFAGWVTVEL